jgi:hypothetical protein
VQESRANYLWLCRLGLALGREKQFRYPKPEPHKSLAVIEYASRHIPDYLPLTSVITPMTMEAINPESGCRSLTPDPVLNYRAYYHYKATKLAASWSIASTGSKAKNRLQFGRPRWFNHTPGSLPSPDQLAQDGFVYLPDQLTDD